LPDRALAPAPRHHARARDSATLGLRMPDDYRAVYDSTMGRFWLFSERARALVVERLASLTCGRVLTDKEQAELGIRFGDRRYGDLVFLLEPGWLVSSSNSNAPRWHPTGMHGYHPDDPSSDAIFLSNQAPLRPIRTTADAYACMAHPAGLSPAPAEAPPR